MRLRRRALWACVGLVVLAAASGCSIAIAESGYDDVFAPVRESATRGELHQRLGSPNATGTCPDGRPFERFRVRQRIPGLWQALYLPAQGAGPSGLIWSALEPIFTPIAAITSEAKRVPVIVVYGPDERVVYAFTDRPEWRLYDAVKPLTDEVRSRLRQTEPSTWASQVSAYIDEVRRRAACVGAMLSPSKEATLAALIPAMEEAVWGIATPEEALGKFDEITWPISQTRS